MAVAFDASSSGQILNATTSKSWSHTASGSNRVVFVGVSWLGYPSGSVVSSVTYGGQAMTAVGAASSVTGGNISGYTLRSQLFKLVAPPTGSQTVVVTLSTAAYGACGSVSYTGVDQTTPNGTQVTNSGTGPSISTTVTGVSSSNMVAGLVACSWSSGSLTAGQTQRWTGDAASDSYRGAYEDTTSSSGSVAMTWTTSSSQVWCATAVEILQAVSPPSNSVAPAITPTSGTAGTTLFTCDTGTWSNTPDSYAYQWKLDGSNVGTNANTYTPVAAGSLTCVVTATNAGGSTPATSNAVTVSAASAAGIVSTASAPLSGVAGLTSSLGGL